MFCLTCIHPLAGLWIEGMIDWLTDWLIDWFTDRLSDWMTDWLIDSQNVQWLTASVTDCWLTYHWQMIDWLLFDWLTDTDWLTDWLTRWLIHLLTGEQVNSVSGQRWRWPRLLTLASFVLFLSFFVCLNNLVSRVGVFYLNMSKKGKKQDVCVCVRACLCFNE